MGLVYFGKRYLNTALQRWVSADPLEVHAAGEADANLYAYVRGRALQAIDPLGLEDTNSEGGTTPTPVPFGPEGAAPGTRFVFGGGPDRLVPEAEYGQVADGKEEFVYDPNATLPDNVDVNNLSAEAYTQAVANALRQAIEATGNCSGAACGTARPGEPIADKNPGTADALALAGGLAQGQGPQAGGSDKGSPGGGNSNAKGSDLQQSIVGGSRIASTVGVGGIAARAAKKAASQTAKNASRVWPKHHAFPKYLGGAADQTLKKIPRKLHYRFHSSLDKWKGGKYARSKGASHFEGMSQQEIIDDLREFYRTAEGGAFKQFLPDFEQAVKESL